MVSFSFTSVS